MKSILVYNQDQVQEYPLYKEIKLNDKQTVVERDNMVFLGDQVIELYKEIKLDDGRIIKLFEQDSKSYHKKNPTINFHETLGEVRLGKMHLSIEEKEILNPDKMVIYVNGKSFKDEVIHISYGDQILIRDIILINKPEIIMIIGNHDSYQTDLVEAVKPQTKVRDFPHYRRSPRIVKRMKKGSISLLKPQEKNKMNKGELIAVIVTPLISIIGTIVVSIFMPRGIYIYITMATTVVTTTFSVTKVITERRKNKVENDEKQKIYESYLLNVRERLEGLRKEETLCYMYHNPSIKELANLVDDYSSRIYEKDESDDDFLDVTIGTRKEESNTKISLDIDELETEKNDLLDEAKDIKSKYAFFEHKPVTVNLRRGHVGLVGDKEDIHQQIKQMLAQITFFQSYHDVEVIMLYNEAYKEKFDYVKWYPHVRISAINVRGNIYVEKVRDQILSSLTQILKQRKEICNDRKREGSFNPHYVIFVDDYFLVMNHSIMEYLQEATTDLGFTLIFSAKQRADLPENISTVILVEDKYTNHLLLAEKEVVNKLVASPQIENVDLEKMARNLAVLEHQKGVHSQIPEAITFFELYGVEHPEELNVTERWQESNSHKTLSVPLGVRGKDDIVYLDLHEKAHGPHGLVAGTTGSGKSEIIQSYILSLAVNFHPDEVGFLLIDYKGGGMANLFKNLPHLLGTITNLDGSESMRALESIKSELKRRQRIFNEVGVNNIILYNKLYKAGKAKEALPSLFLISDEFAELKKEQPEFMSELVSVARIGRTLGIKLILATQKPSGVVDDQIWSNSKFKLALKVQNESDSKEVIKTADAAYITQAGRSYLQVGNNEIYELFQSAWSGASYKTDQEAIINNLVYKVNEIGQMQLINKDLSKIDEGGKVEEVTQLDVVVDYLQAEYERLKAVPVTKPWLPSLSDKIVSPNLPQTVERLEELKQLDLTYSMGIVDIPERQEQKEYQMDFIKDGNLALFASSGYGKSMTIGMIMLSLAVKNNPELLNFYIVDLGNSALIPYVNLPHTADYMTFDSIEKLIKFMKLMNKTMKERKQLLSKAMVQNYETYNQMFPEDPIKAIIVFVDNYDVAKEMEVPFDDFMLRLSRDGAGLGIYVVLSASRTGVLRYSVLNNFKDKVALYNYDRNEVYSVVGRSAYTLPEVKGRAMVKLDNINIMQIYTPFAFEDNIEFLTKLKQYNEVMKENYHGEIAKGLPILPEIFTSNMFEQFEEEGKVKVKAGLCVNEVVIVDAQILAAPYIIIGPQKSGKTNFLELVLNQMSGKTYIFDNSTLYLMKYKNHENMVYVTTEEDVNTFVEDLYGLVENRKFLFREAMQKEGTINPKEFYENCEPVNIFIDGVNGFIALFETKKYGNFAELFKEACQVGINVVVTVMAGQALKGIDDLSKFFKTATSGIVLGNQGTTTIFPVNSTKEYPFFTQGLIFDNGSYRRILIPRYVEEGGSDKNENMAKN